jgi:AcrR family transcriptional regulator
MQNHDIERSPESQPGRGNRAVQARGGDTRRRILSAALDVFATEGYEGTTTRRLAEVAQVNLPSIQYYFGSKEGLYRAVVSHLVETLESRVAPAVDQVIQELAVGPPSREQAMTLLCLMLDTFTVLVTDQTVPDWQSRAMFFARAEIEPSTALDPLHDWASRRIFRPCAMLVGYLINQSEDAEQTLLHTIMLLGQVTIFCNQKGLRVLGWPTIGPERVQTIQALVRARARSIFRHPDGSQS